MKTKLMFDILELAIRVNSKKDKMINVHYEGVVNALYTYIYDSEGNNLEVCKVAYFGDLSTVEDFEDIKYMLEQMLNEAKKVA